MNLFSELSFHVSKTVTKTYSNSFFQSANLLEPDIKNAIFGIYGFVRYADEIVDSFLNFDQAKLLLRFETDVYDAIHDRISMNPVLDAFQQTVHKHNLPTEYINAFLKSMKMDLEKKKYLTKEETEQYIYGSADVVGLMCLKVFCQNNDQLFEELKYPAMKLGSAFQKVNFVRDLKADTQILHRNYFYYLGNSRFDDPIKKILENEIQQDFNDALCGIRKLPGRSKLAVLTAFYYYNELLKLIRKSNAETILNQRLHVSRLKKYLLSLKALINYSTGF